MKKLKTPLSSAKKIESKPLFPIVGIGASAGGLEAFSQLLKDLPVTTGMAFVLIQHLDPTHPSLLAEAITKVTKMKVVEIEDGLRLRPNEVYIIPSSSEVGILRGRFTLFSRDINSRKPNMAIDFFFQSLALDCGSRAIGVVLSGNATDGTEGLRAIQAKNGVTFIQDPKTAKFDGMPQSAMNADVTDFCLPIPELALELIRLSQNPHVSGGLEDPLYQPKNEQDLKKVFVLLRTEGVDFSEYKPPTIKRRLVRRMALLKIGSLSKYIKYLQSNPEEIKILAADVLIHVTSFFRDPEVFKRLQDTVFPEIVKDKSAENPIRIWVTGCSSGEEVYSIAISLLEFLGDRASKYQIQMFGSDVSERMIERARIGFYSDEDIKGVGAERLKQYFIKVEGGYKINNIVRSFCVFVRHDLARDPPFSKLDLVTCRNVLIYFEQHLQKRIISIFHYCLKQPGFLLLGRTESITSHQHLFSQVDKTNKIFSRLPVTSPLHFSTLQNTSIVKQAREPILMGPVRPEVDVAKQIDHLLLSQYAPAGVVINERLDVLQYRGRTGAYLEAPPGQPQLNILKMVREGLFASLKLGIEQAKKKMTILRKENLSFKQNGVSKMCNLVIIPVAKLPNSKEPLFLILFEDVEQMSKPVKASPKTALTKSGKLKEKKEQSRNAMLEHELRATQEYLQSLNEEHQKANDTLNSVNEEFVSGNEELQSMNEELETAKEELQSTNEELSTVNDELQTRNQETAEMNDDLMNLLNSSEIPILILDLNRRIRIFTPEARRLMNLLPADIGRQMDDIKPNIEVENLDQRIQNVIEKEVAQELEVKDRSGKWHRLQIKPYKTIENKIAGAVLSLVNIDTLRRAVIDAEWVSDYAESIVEAVQIPLLVLDAQIKVVSANHVFYDTFKLSKMETIGKSLYELSDSLWNIEGLKNSLGEMLEKETFFQNVSVTCVFGDAGTKVLSLSARPIQSHDGTTMILLAIEDITDRKSREKEKRRLLSEAQAAKSEADKANVAKDLFLATLSHELRTPLTSLILQAQMLQRGLMDPVKVKKACKAIERAAKTQSQLIEDLLDVSRIVTGKLKLELSPVDLNEVIHLAVDTVSALAESKAIALHLELDPSVGKISADPIRLQQVLWNLLTNAIKFTPKGGSIKIEMRKSAHDVEIKVIDHGMGISAEFLPQVFNRFSQSDDSNTRIHGGLGLGLAIVRHVVEMLGGTVSVESAGENQGSTFTILLPLLGTLSEQTEFQELKKKEGTAVLHQDNINRKLHGLRVLLVEDDDEVREVLTEMLNALGAEVRAVSSAEDAIKAYAEYAPTELVMDISMPVEEGYSLLKRIRELEAPQAKNIPALALTALASEQDRSNALTSGFQMHLTKPIDMHQLTNALLQLSALGSKSHA